jgi:septation ring formation regulator
MSQTAYIVAGVTYYIVSVLILIIVLNILSNKEKKYYQKQITDLEREKNLIISSQLLSELNKIDQLVNTEKLRQAVDEWEARFKQLKEEEIPKITDELIEIEDLFNEKEFKKLDTRLDEVELEIYYLKSRSNFLLDEIKEITTSEERNRETITKLKSKYRQVVSTYNKNKNDYKEVCAPLELQFENVDKLFVAFEDAMEENEYEEVNKIVKGIDDLIGNLEVVVHDAPNILLLAKTLIPNKMADLKKNQDKLSKEGFNLDYLNLDYNIEETNKKLQDVLSRLNVLNVKDSILELKTINDYFDKIYSEFDFEKEAKTKFEDQTRSLLVRANKVEKDNNALYRKLDTIKYSYDLSDEDVKVVEVIRTEIKEIKKVYNEIIDAYRNKSFAYSRLVKETNKLSNDLSNTEEKFKLAYKSLGTLEDDERRAREELNYIKYIILKAKDRINDYKFPEIPNTYYVELEEANVAIDYMVDELNKKPISIKTLNIRLDTARDLSLKVLNTANELVKTAMMVETSIIYGNRYRPLNNNLDIELTRAEELFNRGEYNKSLETTIRAIEEIEPGIYNKLLEAVKK